MSLLHYLTLQGEPAAAIQLQKTVSDALVPIEQYQRNAITALNNKKVTAQWRKLEKATIELRPIERVFEITPQTRIKLYGKEKGWFRITRDREDDQPLSDDFEPDFSDSVVIGKGKNREKIKISEADFLREDSCFFINLPDMDESLSIINDWAGYSLDVEPAWITLDRVTSIQKDGVALRFSRQNQEFVIDEIIEPDTLLLIDGNDVAFSIVGAFNVASLGDYSLSAFLSVELPKLESAKIVDITEKSLHETDVDALKSSKNKTIHYEKITFEKDKILLHVDSHDNYHNEIFQTKEGWKFRALQKKGDEPWIQLVDDEEDEGNEAPSRSKLDYFFDDQIEIIDGNKQKLKVHRSNRENFELLLKKPKSRTPEYPSKGNLRVTVNIYQLYRQQDAINWLIDQPVPEQEGLIKLLEAREFIQWPPFKPQAVTEWKVLTDESYDGFEQQRKFVEKALATPDFSFLDGPPGSGKTTVILELIWQLAGLQNKKILLCGSTHAAINNVLERIRDKDMLTHILPVRIGAEDRAIGVQEFQIDNLLTKIGGKYNIRLLLESSNLVCGTTMGILSLFRDTSNGLSPSLPPFDYLIIDESSKTTFQEFLVPALYAKKWILAGDVKQLSPFTDRDQIVGNLENLQNYKGKTLSLDVQKACWYLQKFFPYHKNRFIVAETSSVIEAIRQELDSRLKDEKVEPALKNTHISLISDEFTKHKKHGVTTNVSLYSSNGVRESSLSLVTNDIIFISHAAFQQIHAFLPHHFIVVGREDWIHTEHAFRNNVKYSQQQKFHNGRKELLDHLEISKYLNTFFRDKTWADEVVWRLERVYSLRFAQDKVAGNKRRTPPKSGREKEVERLVPRSVKGISERIFRIRDIAFPSILEALTGHGLQKRKHEQSNTLNQGFNSKEILCRYTTLTYQHRMHPEISDYPRKQFYTGKNRNGEFYTSLKDGANIKENRNWSYPRYSSTKHRCWIDIEGQVSKSSNQKEVARIEKELKAFLKWSKKHPSENKETANKWEVAVLTFYKAQEKALRGMLQKLSGKNNAMSRFPVDDDNVLIKLATVDFFQGQEADLVFLSMVNTYRDGFMDSPNRLNVSVTRARYQLVVVGKHEYYSQNSRSDDLSNLAKQTEVFTH